MLIGEVVKLTGLSRDTIRFYEKMHLLEVKRGSSLWNNYKDYSQENIARLLLIKKCKSFGFTLNEIKELLFLVETQKASCQLFSDLVQQKISTIDQKIKKLEASKQMILHKLEIAKEHCKPYSKQQGNCKELAAI